MPHDDRPARARQPLTFVSTLASPRSQDHLAWLEPVATVAVALVATGLILSGVGELPPAPMDQAFANVDLHISHQSGHWEFHYPVLSFAGGVTASLAVGIYKLLAPFDPAHLNYHVKILACLYFLATTRWLARLALTEPMDRLTALVLVASSGLTYLEPSTEVLAGGIGNLFVCLWIRGSPGFVAGIALAIFGLIKIELVAVAMVMLACALASKQSGGRRAGLAAGFLAGASTLLVPDVYLYGWRASFLGREFDAFGAHYCALFHDQFSGACLSQDFPQAHGLGEILWLYPDRYLAFLAKSWTTSLWETVATLNFSILGILFALGLATRRWASAEVAVCATQALACLAATFVVASIFAFMHPRYLARAFGLTAILVVAASRALAETPQWRRLRAWPAFALAANVVSLPGYLAQPHGF